MLQVQQQDSGRLIEEKILFAPSTPHSEYINFASQPGEMMRYEKLPYTQIDFPGEYDIKNIFIKAFLGKNKKLNYVFGLDNMKIGIVQSPDILEDEEEFANMDEIIYTDDTIASKLDQLEYEGEKQKIDL